MTNSGNTSRLNVALVGCGVIARNHARAIDRTEGLLLTALVDPVPSKAAALADLVVDELGGPRPAQFGSLADALAAGSVGLVVICTPSGTHVELALEAVAAGVHVVVEKPVDVTMARGRALAAAVRPGQVVSVICQHRFDPASVAVARAAHGGGLGRVTSAVASVAWWRSQEYYDSGEWRGTWALDGGGALMNQGVHTVDLLVWFLGEPVEVFAHTGGLAHDRVEVEDVAVATIRFASGALAVLHATTAAYPGLSVRIQVMGSAGSATIDDDQLELLSSDGRPENRAADLVPPDELRGAPKADDSWVVGHARQFEDVVDAIRTGRDPGVRVVDALLDLAVVRAVYLSSSLGRPVLVADVLAGLLDDEPVATGGVLA
ncbi:Gfo/Idh/MocA family protein [Cellulomonas sp. McL0617]|uniref:Gfo/Idh/MocA family protein n=1 Tax=Cellulomonas sp. McL0617 TaxID=3415675 RepID=UPI003CEC1D05